MGLDERKHGFDDFAAKWVPPPPAWVDGPAPPWTAGASEKERARLYMQEMGRSGGDAVRFSTELQENLLREVAAGAPIFSILDRLLGSPEVPDQRALVALFQRLFGVPITRARYLASWRPSNRSAEAERVLNRVLLCAQDARQAGLWSPPKAAGDSPHTPGGT